MALDISRIYGQIEAMADGLKSRGDERAKKLSSALDALEACGETRDILRSRVENARTTWLIAGLKGDPGSCHPAPACPGNYVVVSSDGSHIDVDRNQLANLFLLNIGTVCLWYGDSPNAECTSVPTLYFGDGKLSIIAPDGRHIPIEGPLLGMVRGIEEFRSLADKMESLPSVTPVLGLADGSLIMWGLVGQRYDDFVVKQLLDEGLLKQFERFYALSSSRRSAVASYISFPRSADVINLLRLQICPHDIVDCDRHCNGKYVDRPCDVVGGLADRDVFNVVLAEGERSALFLSRSSIIERYNMHRVCFFYVRTGEEVGRVEVPLWVADDTGLLDLVHAVTVEQCRKGFGYPVSISEAHEKAVVTGADRAQFWEVVRTVMQQAGIDAVISSKQRSKNTRWL